MHDLNTITRLNAEAFADSIQNFRKQGRWVLARYDGLTLMSIETFLVQSDAQIAFDNAASQTPASERSVLFTPVVADLALKRSDFPGLRDQSEDRKQPYSLEQLAALGQRSVGDPPADLTLGDYINRKNRSL
jgi:hypothetical protein